MLFSSYKKYWQLLLNIIACFVIAITLLYVGLLISYAFFLPISGTPDLTFFQYVDTFFSPDWGVSTSMMMGMPITEIVGSSRLFRMIEFLWVPILLGLIGGIALGRKSFKLRGKWRNKVIQFSIAIGIALFSVRLTRPIAARTASKLLSVPKGESDRYVGLPPLALEKISKRLDIGRQIDPNQIDEVIARADAAEKALFDYCEFQPPVRAVMEDFQVSRDDLKEVYSQLIAAGAGQWSCGHWVAASALPWETSAMASASWMSA